LWDYEVNRGYYEVLLLLNPTKKECRVDKQLEVYRLSSIMVGGSPSTTNPKIKGRLIAQHPHPRVTLVAKKAATSAPLALSRKRAGEGHSTGRAVKHKPAAAPR
jgi:hypothetical protein